MLSWCIVTFVSTRLKAFIRFPPLRGMYQKGGTCKDATQFDLRRSLKKLDIPNQYNKKLYK